MRCGVALVCLFFFFGGGVSIYIEIGVKIDLIKCKPTEFLHSLKPVEYVCRVHRTFFFNLECCVWLTDPHVTLFISIGLKHC